MRRLQFVFLMLVMPLTFFAQMSSSSVKLGTFNPGATDGGFIIGYESIKHVDPNFGFGWSIDWFNKNYVDRGLESKIDEEFGIPGGTTNELRAKTNLHEFPILFNINGTFPASPQVTLYVTGGVGAEFLLIRYKNFVNPDENEFKGAFDFNWRFGFGANFVIGRRTDIITEITYHSSSPSWTYEVEDADLGIQRTFERSFDMSGIMARIGIRFYY